MGGRNKLIGIACLLIIVVAILLMPVQARKDGISYYQAEIISQADQQTSERQIRMLSGPDKDHEVTANVGSMVSSLDLAPPEYKVGERVLVSLNDTSSPATYVIIDNYRLPSALWLFFGVVLLSIIFAGWRGLGALIGLLFSVVILTQFIIPQILSGSAPYLVTAIGIMVISLPGIYISHGVSRRTTLALISTYITLIVAVILSVIAVKATGLTGLSTDSIWLLSQTRPDLNIQGLFLCGLLISLIGILDDVTVAQAAAVHELKEANPKFGFKELYTRGLKIGREHISSLINTLVLVYVGASFLFIVYLAVIFPFPLLVVLNSEFIMNEIVRSIVGSAALILAIPITSVISAYFISGAHVEHKKRRLSVPS